MNLIDAAKAVIPDLEALEANKRALGKPNYADQIRAKIVAMKDALKADIEYALRAAEPETKELEVKKTKKPVKPPKKC